MASKTVTVVTPSYNSARFIERNIHSVKQQDYPLMEHVIVDGGSTDGTVDVLRKHDGQVTWISEKDDGFADACNKGIRMSKGEIINIQNADDFFYDDESVSKAIRIFESNSEAGAVFGDCIHIDQNGNTVWDGLGYGKQYTLERLVCHEFTLPQGSAFFTRRAAHEAGLLDTDISGCNETYLWMKIALKHPIVYAQEVLSCYTLHRGQISRRNVPRIRKRITDKFFSLDLPHNLAGLRDRAYNGAADFEIWKLLEYSRLFGIYRWILSSGRRHRYLAWLNPAVRALYRWTCW